MKFHIFHEWDKWTTYEKKYRHVLLVGALAGKEFDYGEVRQKRECRVCGKLEDRHVRDGVL